MDTELIRSAHFQALRYQPHPGQVEIHDSQARHRVAACGRRFGKSIVGGHELSMQSWPGRMMLRELEEAQQRLEYWIVGPEYSDSEKEFRVLWNDVKRLELPMDKPGSYNNSESGEMVLSLFGGRWQVHAKSAKYPGTLVGEGLAGVVLSEAAKLKGSVWSRFIRPTLADRRGWSLWLSTPEGKNHFYEQWQRGLDPAQPEWASWRMPSWVNPYVFPLGEADPEIAEMRAEMSHEKAQQEIEASFTDYVGQVFKQWDEAIHVKDLRYRPDLPLYLACDFGWTNPFICLAIQVDVWDTVYVLAEYRVDRRDISDIARDLAAVPLFRQAAKLYPDPAEPQDASVLGRALKTQVMTGTGGELKYRLEAIRHALRQEPAHLPDGHPEKQPKLQVDRRCTGLIREMGDYRYPDNKSEVRPNPEQPMDKDDHGPEALGRFFRGYYGVGRGSMGHARVSKANISSSGRLGARGWGRRRRF